MQLNILPVRMHVDQDAIDFIKRFLSFSTPRDDGDGSEQPADSSLQPAQFIRKQRFRQSKPAKVIRLMTCTEQNEPKSPQ